MLPQPSIQRSPGPLLCFLSGRVATHLEVTVIPRVTDSPHHRHQMPDRTADRKEYFLGLWVLENSVCCGEAWGGRAVHGMEGEEAERRDWQCSPTPIASTHVASSWDGVIHIQLGVSPLVNPLWKSLQTHPKLCLTNVILKLVKLTMKMNNGSDEGDGDGDNGGDDVS